MFVISVAGRLLKHETVEYRGHLLRLTRFENEAFKNSGASFACGEPARPSPVLKQGGLWHRHSAASSSADTEPDNDLLTHWWKPVDYVEGTEQRSPRQYSSSDVELQRKQQDLSHSSSGSACKLKDSLSSDLESGGTESVKDLTIGSGKDMEDEDVCEKLKKFTVESSFKQVEHGTERSASAENQCRRISFPDEKLRLIHKLVLSSCAEFRAEVRVKVDKGVVKMSGTVDDVDRTDMTLHELVAGFVISTVRISETSAKLLSAKSGEDWLDACLANEQLVAVFYVKDTAPMLMTDSRDRLTRVKSIVESSLVTKRRQLERHHIKLLQSAVWNECVKNLQSEYLLLISVDYGADMKLVVEGCADGVEVALDQLSKMLGENSRISHTVRLRCGVYRVLCFSRGEIQQQAK